MTRVRVFLRAGRKFFEAQWTDPVSGRKKTESTGKTTRKDAVRKAAKLEADINEGRYKPRNRMTWADFHAKYKSEVLAGRAKKTRQKYGSMFNAMVRLIAPLFARSVDADVVSKFQVKLRDEGAAEATIKSQLSCLRAVLNWGKRMGLISETPNFEMPLDVSRMKGRAPTDLEFATIRNSVKDVVGKALEIEWQFVLDGLWTSGLRLGEAWELDWTDDRNLCVDFSGRRPMFRIQGSADKSREFRMLPMAPEFAELLETVPKKERRGKVFQARSPEEMTRPQLDWCSKLICRMGEKADVKVAEYEIEGPKGKPIAAFKYASAHDFRRAFGFRWAYRVLPPILCEMMRHKSIQTTLAYYVGRNAEVTADHIWAAFANEVANIPKIHRPKSA